MDETTTAAPIRRSLIHACRVVNQNRREPTLDLRDAPAIAAGVTSLPVYGGWVRRSRSAVRRIHPDRRHYQKPRDKQTDDSHEYPTFGFHIPPPWLNRHPPEDPVSRLRLALSTSLGKTEPSPRCCGPPKLVSHHPAGLAQRLAPERNADDIVHHRAFTYNNDWINLATCSYGAVSLSTPRPTVRATRYAARRSPLTRWWRATEGILAGSGQTRPAAWRGRRDPHGRFSRGGGALFRPPPPAPSSPAFLRRPEPIVRPNSSISRANADSGQKGFATMGIRRSAWRPPFAALPAVLCCHENSNDSQIAHRLVIQHFLDAFEETVAHAAIRIENVLAGALDGSWIQCRPINYIGGKGTGEFESFVMRLG